LGVRASALLTINGFAPGTLNPTAPALDVYNFASNNTVPIGQSIILAFQAGNGFSFDSFSVTAIPEPASVFLLLIGLAAVCVIRFCQA
jgi:PEP-CTERM motif